MHKVDFIIFTFKLNLNFSKALFDSLRFNHQGINSASIGGCAIFHFHGVGVIHTLLIFQITVNAFVDHACSRANRHQNRIVLRVSAAHCDIYATAQTAVRRFDGRSEALATGYGVCVGLGYLKLPSS